MEKRTLLISLVLPLPAILNNLELQCLILLTILFTNPMQLLTVSFLLLRGIPKYIKGRGALNKGSGSKDILFDLILYITKVSSTFVGVNKQTYDS